MILVIKFYKNFAPSKYFSIFKNIKLINPVIIASFDINISNFKALLSNDQILVFM